MAARTEGTTELGGSEASILLSCGRPGIDCDELEMMCGYVSLIYNGVVDDEAL